MRQAMYYNVIFSRVRVAIVGVVLHILIHQAKCMRSVTTYIAICSLFASTLFFHIIS